MEWYLLLAHDIDLMRDFLIEEGAEERNEIHEDILVFLEETKNAILRVKAPSIQHANHECQSFL